MHAAICQRIQEPCPRITCEAREGPRSAVYCTPVHPEICQRIQCAKKFQKSRTCLFKLPQNTMAAPSKRQKGNLPQNSMRAPSRRRMGTYPRILCERRLGDGWERQKTTEVLHLISTLKKTNSIGTILSTYSVLFDGIGAKS